MVPWLKPTSASARRRKSLPLKLRVEEEIEHGTRLRDALPAFRGLAKSEREPLPARGAHRDPFGCIGSDESRLRQVPLPLTAELNEVLTVGPVAVQQNDQRSWGAGARREARSIERG